MENKTEKSELIFTDSKSLYIDSKIIQSSKGDIIDFSDITSTSMIITNTGMKSADILEQEKIFPNKNIGQIKSKIKVDAENLTGLLSDPPVNVFAKRGDWESKESSENILLYFDRPSFTGGSNIINYTSVYDYKGKEKRVTYHKSPILINELDNGNSYTFKIFATNITGDSELSLVSNNIIPCTYPDPPTNLSKIPNDTKVSLSWNAPKWNGGSSILKYKVYVTDTVDNTKNKIAETADNSTSLDIENLINGREYDFSVTAINDASPNSGESDKSETIRTFPRTFPDSPTNLSKIPHDTFVSLSWNTPKWNGGSSILKYRVYVTDTVDSDKNKIVETSDDSTSLDIENLINGRDYDFSVTAINDALKNFGEGTNSEITRTFPRTYPNPPTNLSKIPNDTFVSLSWNAPEWNGGSSILKYKVYVTDTVDNTKNKIAETSDNSTSLDIENLINGREYEFSVTAINDALKNSGESDKSVSAKSIPRTVPEVPTNFSASDRNQSTYLTWKDPQFNGGSVITKYKVYVSNSSYSKEYEIEDLYTIYNQETSSYSYTVPELLNGTSYNFVISAWNIAGEGAKSGTESSSPVTFPSAPSIATIALNESVDVDWDEPDNGGSVITEYKVYVYTKDSQNNLIELKVVTIPNIPDSDNTYKNINELVNGTTYTFKVLAINRAGPGLFSIKKESKPVTKPGQPSISILESAKEDGVITVNWNPPSFDGGDPIDSYKIYYSSSSSSEVVIENIDPSLRKYKISGLNNGVEYSFQVSAYDTYTLEGIKSEVSKAIPARKPSKPTLGTLTTGVKSLTVNWSGPTGLEKGGAEIESYTLYHYKTSDLTSLVSIPNISSLSSNYVINNLLDNTEYTISITATNRAGEGSQSDTKSLKTAAVPDMPTLKAEGGVRQVILSWTLPKSDGGSAILGYSLYYVGSNTLITTTTNISHTVASLNNGTNYSFYVRAYNAVGYSDPSTSSATTHSLPSAPQSLTSSRGVRQITLNWGGPSNTGGSPVTSYNVYVNGGYNQTVYGGSATVGGLGNGTGYTFKVNAVTAVGQGSDASTYQVTYGLPSAPTSLSIHRGIRALTFYWGGPHDNGGTGVTHYNVYLNGGYHQTVYGGGATVGGLGNGTGYNLEVRAVNAAGEGGGSSIYGVTYGLPGIPLNYGNSTGVDNVRQATIYWGAPGSDLPIRGYRVYFDGPWHNAIYDGGNTAHTITGLPDDGNFTFAVVAYSDVGQSNPTYYFHVRTVGKPSEPQNGRASVGQYHVNLYWDPPYYSGGSYITNYSVYLRGIGVFWTTETTLYNGQLATSSNYLAEVYAYTAAGHSAFPLNIYFRTQDPPPPPPSSCFTGNSLVTMSDRSLKRIEDVKVGEMVLSGITLEPVKVLMYDEVIGVTSNTLLVGINNKEPFITSSHSILSKTKPRMCFDHQLAIKRKHWSDEDIEPMNIGSILFKYEEENKIEEEVKSVKIEPCQYSKLYALVTSDHSFIVNDICVSDDFPEIEKHKKVSLRIVYMLKMLKQIKDGQKDIEDIEKVLKIAIDYEPDLTEFENHLQDFFHMMTENPSLINHANKLWMTYFDMLK
jgi:titin